ncbi:MAG: AAA family ATPase [Chloroflexi bacterium]|nr:AAA family ATPase [Chloroflexota bacterium]
MPLTRVQLKNFTAFAELDLELSPGINVLVGANGTGKTHLMKVCYSMCEISRTDESPSNKLIKVFLPSGGNRGRLVKQVHGIPYPTAEVYVYCGDSYTGASFQNDRVGLENWRRSNYSGPYNKGWAKSITGSTYIPAKEMLSNAPGFRSLYAQREIHFEEVYADILDRAFLPPLREPFEDTTKHLLGRIEGAMGGEVSIKNEEFFLSGKKGDIEFTLLAEGMRKLGLLWLLIRNGSLRPGSVLFWDEPETNLNPKLYGVAMEVLLELQRNGVQVFLATHDYVILRELDLQMEEEDDVAFHSLYHDPEGGEIACQTARRYLDINPNAIEEAFEDIYDQQLERSLGSFGR